MNIKPLHLNLGVLAFSLLAALAISIGLLILALPLWEASASLTGPVLMIVSWAVLSFGLASTFMVLTLAVRTLTLAAIASFNRGIYAFRWLPPADAAVLRASRIYREWCYVRNGQMHMGLIIGRLEIVLVGTPRAVPVHA